MRTSAMAKALILALALLPPGRTSAGAEPQRGAVGVATVSSIRALRLDSPVVVDGALSEPAWQGPPAVTRFLQSDPVEGAAPSESTWVWVAYDDAALYVAARCWDAHPDSIIANLVRRDVDVPSDRFTVALDPFHDRRSGYYFMVNAAGVLYDGTIYNDNSTDDAWDAVWEGRARRDAHGWTVEMRIPFSQMRYRPGAEQVWGVDFRREFARGAEQDWVVFTPKKESGFASRFPELVGIQNGHRSSALEVLPYVTGKGEYLAHDPGDPFHDHSRYTPGLGADLRRGVGNSLTLNATVNPDFGQVEVDPAVVNLSDVETYFQEKRPFFTENARIFSFGNEGASDYWGFNWPEPAFFYSRRIGRAPQGTVPDGADFADVPVATHILGAAKLTGKLAPSWNFGTLHAVTAREGADYLMGGQRSTLQVEPLTYYGVARGQKEFPQGFNGLGAMASLVDRRFGHDGLADQLNGRSLVAGLDGWHFLDRDKSWVLSGWAVTSRVEGTRARLLDLQTNARHYLQRPDARTLGVDSSATAMNGYGARVWLNKQKGNFFSNSAIGFMDPRFDVNDMGFQSRANVVNAHTGYGYRWTQPQGWRRYAHVLIAGFGGRDFDWNNVYAGMFAGSRLQSVHNQELDLDVAWNPQTLDNRLTRGGPLALSKPGYQFDATLQGDSRRKVSYSLSLGGYRTPATRSFNSYVQPAVTWTPLPNVYLQLGPEVDRNVNDAQYVATVSDPGNMPADFGGNHYVFARLDQTTLSANLRLNVSFTPSLTLQTFIQPLISSGRYTDYKELERSRSLDFLHHSGYDAETGLVYPDVSVPGVNLAINQPSFNFKSLRGNAVLRWEYRPGSALFLVWTQARTDGQLLDGLELRRSLDRLVSAAPDDIFLVKVSYYLGL